MTSESERKYAEDFDMISFDHAMKTKSVRKITTKIKHKKREIKIRQQEIHKLQLGKLRDEVILQMFMYRMGYANRQYAKDRLKFYSEMAAQQHDPVT